MQYCGECGKTTVEGARYCYSCGSELRGEGRRTQVAGNRDDLLLELPLPPQTNVAAPVAEVVEAPEEAIAFSTSASVLVENRKWDAYVTNRKLILHRTVGLFFTKESHQEVDLATVHSLALREEGTLLKEFYLEVDGLVMKGRKSDIVNMYRSVQAGRAQSGRR